MKFLKNIALSLFIAASSVGISSVAFAGPSQAIDSVSVKVTEASKAIESGSSKEDIILIIREAADLVKEIHVSDNIDVKRQRANAHLKKARLAAKKSDLDGAKSHLKEATKAFANLKSLL
ncbi:MAG: hypothetical protein Q9M50_10345 [Methylococcales bacterium]|nr:hypothetical protein [Methylococcales bacterium]